MFYKYRKIFWRIFSYLVYNRFFKSVGSKSFIIKPSSIVGPNYISLGSNVRIREYARIELLDKHRVPELHIEDNVNIEQNCHLICSTHIHIKKGTSIAPYALIVDTSHPIDQLSKGEFAGNINLEPQKVVLGKNCFIGAHALILPNVELGDRCVVAANAVVTAGKYEDGSVLAGSPAKVIKKV